MLTDAQKPLARASRRLHLGLPAPGRASKPPVPNPAGLSYYERHKAAILARQRANYQADPTKQRAAVRASQAKQLARLVGLVQFLARQQAA